MQLTTRTLGEICDEVGGTIRTGPFGSQLHESDYVRDGTPVVMPKNIIDGKLSTEGIARIGEVDVARLLQHKLREGDIVYGRRGDIGRRALIIEKEEGWICGTGCLRISLGNTILVPKFLYFYLGQSDVIAWIFNQAIGATMPNLNTEIIRSISISYPPLSTQHKIAAILSAYDDLIENNTRRIAILEEMAQSLYREWFVEFRFPGHEKKKMVESVLGMIPEGWEVKTIGDIIKTLGGGTPSTKNLDYWDEGDIIWFSPTDLTTAGMMFITASAKKITGLGLQQSSARIFPAYSVMMTSRATIGVVAINTKLACTNQGFITCIPNESLSAYQIYFWLVENKEKIVSIASGATFKEINRATFRSLPIAIPNVSISQKFNEMLSPVCKQIENLITKNANLRRTRDLLLPRLISGEVDVEKLDIETDEGMNTAVESPKDVKDLEVVLAGEQGTLWR